MLTGSRDGMVRLWDLETGKELRRFEGKSDGLDPEPSVDGRTGRTWHFGKSELRRVRLDCSRQPDGEGGDNRLFTGDPLS